MADDLSAVARFLYEAGTLKHSRRTGWWMAGVNDPESVAEHSWRTSLIASVIAKLEGADPARAAFLAVWHDTQETRTGDVNHLGKKYAPAGEPQAVTADQTTGMPDVLASAIRELVAELGGGVPHPEARRLPVGACGQPPLGGGGERGVKAPGKRSGLRTAGTPKSTARTPESEVGAAAADDLTDS